MQVRGDLVSCVLYQGCRALTFALARFSCYTKQMRNKAKFCIYVNLLTAIVQQSCNNSEIISKWAKNSLDHELRRLLRILI